MAISDAFVHADCDSCSFGEQIQLTALARGSYDMRNVEATLKRDGWLVDGDRTICPSCKPEGLEQA